MSVGSGLPAQSDAATGRVPKIQNNDRLTNKIFVMEFFT